MPTVYTQNLRNSGAILSQRIKSLEGVKDPLSCRDELLLQESVLQDNVEYYAEALETGEKARILAFGSAMNERVKDVIKSKETMAKIEQARAQNLSRETVYVFLKGFAELFYSRMPDQTELITQLFAEAEASILGTSTNEVTEQELFAEMLKTVPMLEVIDVEPEKEAS